MLVTSICGAYSDCDCLPYTILHQKSVVMYLLYLGKQQQNAASDQGLHFLPLIHQFSDTKTGSQTYLLK